MKELFTTLYYSNILSKIFHTLVYCLKQELKDCNTVLDLGCGPDSPIKYCKIAYSVGVDAFRPYIEESKKKKIHSKYILADIAKVEFQPKSFDAVIMIEVLEHLPESVGLETLRQAKKWAKKKIIVTSPNGFLPQGEADNNPYQKHLSSWNFKKMKDLGFRSNGLAGFKFLRRENVCDTTKADLTSSIRFSPRSFWFIVATLSQFITYYVPQLAFELFSVKEINK